MMKKGNAVKKIFLISGVSVTLLIVVIAVSIPVLAWVSAFSALAMEDTLTKNELDNAYINADYADWQTVSIEKIGTFKIPEQWVLCEESDHYYIRNKNGDIIAYGAVVGDPTSKYEGIDSFVGSVAGISIAEIDYQYDTSFSGIDCSGFFSIVVTENSTQHLFRCIRLENHSLRPLEEGTTDFVLIIKDEAEDYAYLVEVAQAVIYSYVYEVN